VITLLSRSKIELQDCNVCYAITLKFDVSHVQRCHVFFSFRGYEKSPCSCWFSESFIGWKRGGLHSSKKQQLILQDWPSKPLNKLSYLFSSSRSVCDAAASWLSRLMRRNEATIYLHFAAPFHFVVALLPMDSMISFPSVRMKWVLRVSLWLEFECKVNGAIKARNWGDPCYCVSFRRWGSILGDTRYVPKRTNHQI